MNGETNSTAVPKHFDYSFFEVSCHTYIQGMQLHYFYHSQIANIKSIDFVESKDAMDDFKEQFKESILISHSRENSRCHDKHVCTEIIYYILKTGITVGSERNTVEIYFNPSLRDDVEQLAEWFSKYPIKEKNVPSIYLVTNKFNGLGLSKIRLKKPRLNIKTHYNDDLQLIHKSLLKKLRSQDKGGLILLHGKPGTGKSTYIRYLISLINKEAIFLSPKLAGSLDSPGLIQLLIDHKNAVFIIEDAEDLLVSRETTANSSISILLNITDGLLSEGLGIQVIATFNTSISNIDKALLRKGRLLGMYDFQELEISKTSLLLEKITKEKHIVTKPMALSEIYHMKELSFEFQHKRKPIGFLNNVNCQ